MLMSAEIKGCVTWFIYFLDLLWVRYNCAKLYHCRICEKDFREGGPFCPPIREQPWKSPSWIGLKEDTVVGSISADGHSAITLYKLGRGDYNYTIEEMTGYAESTVSCLVKEVCQPIVKILWKESVTKLFPKCQEDFRQALFDMEPEWLQVCFCCNWRFTLTNKMPTRGTRSNETVP